MQELAKAASLLLGAPDEKCILAQWIAENAPFPTNTANNPGNIRCIGDFVEGRAKYPWFLLGQSLLTNQVVVYPDIETGVAAYMLLMHAFYAGVWSKGNPQACLEALGASSWDAGHYAVAGGTPGSSLLAIYAELAKEFPTPSESPSTAPAPAPVQAPAPAPADASTGSLAPPAVTHEPSGQEVAVDATGTGEPVRNFTVPTGGEWITNVARSELGDATRWPEIYALNPSVDIRNMIPGGTVLLLPKS